MKTNESLCEVIGAIAVALFMALLVVLWFFQMVNGLRTIESNQHRPAETSGESMHS